MEFEVALKKLCDNIALMEKDNKTYEINYLITPLIPEDKVMEDVAVFRKIIEDNKGLVLNEDQVKMQKLSYAIKKFDNAYFGWFKFSAGANAVDNIKNGFSKNEKILRALITEVVKDNIAQFAPRKGAGMAKGEDSVSETSEKVEIKPEQIDEKLEEILKKSSL